VHLDGLALLGKKHAFVVEKNSAKNSAKHLFKQN
jgi:hypothetical protein